MRPGREVEEPVILGECPAIRRAAEIAKRFAPSDLRILIKGATGTGKELFARAIHHWSGRRGALVDINCASLPRELADSLLFGHRRGAFTGAVETVHGLVEEASGGTLFLDEVTSLPIEAQAKLLRVLERGEVRRVGETEKRPVLFRTVSAALDDLDEGVRMGQFRLDLMQRLAEVVIDLPPLIARGNDVPLLAAAFARECKRTLGDGAATVLCSYRWPGNVRELRAVIRRAVYLTENTEIGTETIERAMALGCPGLGRNGHAHGADRHAEPMTREGLLDICAAHAWHAERIANALGVRRTKLFSVLKTLGVSLRAGRSRLPANSSL